MKTEASATPKSKQCPYCAETIRFEAEKCRYCGSDLRHSPRLVRRLAASPAIPALSIIIGLASGTTELLQFMGVGGPDGPTGFGPADAPEEDDGSALLLVVALVVGAAGCIGALLMRRRPALAALVLAGAGAVGLLATLIGGTNWLLVALSCLLLAVAAGAVVLAAPGRSALVSRDA